MPMLNALSFDVEEWYHAELVRQRAGVDRSRSQVEQAISPILDLLARRNLHATFFIVGEVMAQHPQMVRTIALAGHEIGCHTMSHRPLWDLTPEGLRAELRAFRVLYERAVAPGSTGYALNGFRAPTFSLMQKTSWALRVLAEEGFGYDSSIFPVANYMYGVNGGPLGAYRPSSEDLRREDSGGGVIELPMTVWEVAGRRLPVSGGFYLRALPAPLLTLALRSVSRLRPIVLYLHPWEAFAATPVIPGLDLTDRLITYYNRRSALTKLERILDSFSFAPLFDVLARMGKAPTPAVAEEAAEC